MPNFPDFIQSCRPGDIQGIGGINCKHSWAGTREEYPPQYSDKELAEINRKSAEIHEWINKRGETKKYNQYEAEQEMRRRENDMRKTRSLAAGLREGGDVQGFTEQQARYISQIVEYERFCDTMGFRPDMKRVTIDGLGRMI